MKILLIILSFVLGSYYCVTGQINAQVGILFPTPEIGGFQLNIGYDLILKDRLTMNFQTGYNSVIHTSNENNRIFEFNRIPIEYKFYFPNELGQASYAAFMGLNFNISQLSDNNFNPNLKFTNLGVGLTFGAKFFLLDGIEWSIMGVLNRDFKTLYKGNINGTSYALNESGIRVTLGYDIKKLLNSVRKPAVSKQK